MTQKFYTNIDLRGNKLASAVLAALPPTGQKQGMLGWDGEAGPVVIGFGNETVYLDAFHRLGIIENNISDWMVTKLAQVNADVGFNGRRLINIDVPSEATDAATKGYVDGAVSDLEGRLGSVGGDAILRTEMGVAGGVATLDPATGLVPNSQLPSYVDDVIEAVDFAALPATGEGGKIYVTINNGNVYRWSGSAYIRINDAVSTAETATKLATARSITLDGAVEGTANFDGSANITIDTTLNLATAVNGPLELDEGILTLHLDPETMDVTPEGKLTALVKVAKGQVDFAADENGIVNETIDLSLIVEPLGIPTKFWLTHIEDLNGNKVNFEIKHTLNGFTVTGEGCEPDEDFTFYWKA